MKPAMKQPVSGTKKGHMYDREWMESDAEGKLEPPKSIRLEPLLRFLYHLVPRILRRTPHPTPSKQPKAIITPPGSSFTSQTFQASLTVNITTTDVSSLEFPPLEQFSDETRKFRDVSIRDVGLAPWAGRETVEDCFLDLDNAITCVTSELLTPSESISEIESSSRDSTAPLVTIISSATSSDSIAPSFPFLDTSFGQGLETSDPHYIRTFSDIVQDVVTLSSSSLHSTIEVDLFPPPLDSPANSFRSLPMLRNRFRTVASTFTGEAVLRPLSSFSTVAPSVSDSTDMHNVPNEDVNQFFSFRKPTSTRRASNFIKRKIHAARHAFSTLVPSRMSSKHCSELATSQSEFSEAPALLSGTKPIYPSPTLGTFGRVRRSSRKFVSCLTCRSSNAVKEFRDENQETTSPHPSSILLPVGDYTCPPEKLLAAIYPLERMVRKKEEFEFESGKNDQEESAVETSRAVSLTASTNDEQANGSPTVHVQSGLLSEPRDDKEPTLCCCWFPSSRQNRTDRELQQEKEEEPMAPNRRYSRGGEESNVIFDIGISSTATSTETSCTEKELSPQSLNSMATNTALQQNSEPVAQIAQGSQSKKYTANTVSLDSSGDPSASASLLNDRIYDGAPVTGSIENSKDPIAHLADSDNSFTQAVGDVISLVTKWPRIEDGIFGRNFFRVRKMQQCLADLRYKTGAPLIRMGTPHPSKSTSSKNESRVTRTTSENIRTRSIPPDERRSQNGESTEESGIVNIEVSATPPYSVSRLINIWQQREKNDSENRSSKWMVSGGTRGTSRSL